MVRLISASKFRRKLAEVIDEADVHGEPVYLTNYDEPRAVLIGYRAWEALTERMDDLEDALTLHERQGEPSRPFDEYLAERAQRKQGSKKHDPDTLPLAAVVLR